MADLSVDFCGFKLINPFLLASAPPTGSGGMMKRAYQAGWAGGVTKTLFLDASVIDNPTPRLASLAFSSQAGEPRRIFAFENIELVTERSFETWLKEIRELNQEFPDRMTIASIMDDATRPDGWQKMAEALQAAGADGLELNFSCPHGMPERGMGAAVGQHADLSARVTEWVRRVTDLPVIPKMTPNVTDITLPAKACVEAGADGLAAINTVAAIAGVDLENLTPLPNVWGWSAPGGLSGPAIKPIALRCVAELARAVEVPISGIGGLTTWRDAAEFLLLGASNVQICSAVMARGYSIIEDLTRGLSEYLTEQGFGSLAKMRGRALANLTEHHNLEAKRKVKAQIDQSLCIACDACRISCLDAGHQAIVKRKEGGYEVNSNRCTGCSLCFHVCPVEGCISLLGPE